MGYCIRFAVSGEVLRAVVSGRTRFARAIARDIGEQARASAARRVLVDVSGLQDRIGSLRDLLEDDNLPRRIAVVDPEHDRYYAFAELQAARRGCVLRRFDSHAEALDWLYR